MCIVGRSEFIKLVERYKCLYPTDLEFYDGDGYVLTVKDEVTLHYLEHKNVVSYEVVFTPPSYVAHLTAKSKFGRMGLSFLNAAKVHSGFVGRLALELVNLSNDRQPITIRRRDPLIHVEFITRTGDPSPYEGQYQFQYMSDNEVAMYIPVLSEAFEEWFPRAKLVEQSKKRVMN